MSDGCVTSDPWSPLRRHTAARIALGRAGGSLPTAELLRFSLDHAEARDAVYAELNPSELENSVAGLGLATVQVETLAADRMTYLRRPDLGRRLDEASRLQLEAAGDDSQHFDLSIVVADGLSAQAAQRYAAPLLGTLVPLVTDGFTIAPIAIARQARVALQDEIAVILRARSSVILLGERPGLHAPVSLGAYFVYAPKVGTTDERRNCVSNIRDDGLPPATAAQTLFYLITQGLQGRISGVHLKDERRSPVLPG